MLDFLLSDSFSSIVENWVPSRNPSKWIIINSLLLLLLYSFLTAVDILVALREIGEEPVAAKLYLFWNFSTTFIWCIEAGFQSWWRKNGDHTIHSSSAAGGNLILHHGEVVPTNGSYNHYLDSYNDLYDWWRERKQEIIELIIAVYFLMNSFTLLWTLKIKDEDAQEELYDVAINIIVYIYACIRDLIIIIRGTDGNSHQQDLGRS
mmetsp:Transcript_930/g.1626  ORF Transcript_930/g.1626 Transcript_930/m.1626 type:complete len:206 (-) Transcript_930:239-856(-)